ncbi:MAG: tRNA (adenosine(37)-N6)-dimethylallyltransferase, partial [Bacteroidales bacterium]
YEYNVYEYQKDFLKVYTDIKKRGNLPLMCGGTGMYIEAILKAYKLINVPPDPKLRKSLEKMSQEQLTEKLASYKNLHNTTDITSRKRLFRAIEIEEYYKKQKHSDDLFPELKYILLGIKFDRESRRKRITERLKERLSSGMIEETEALLKSGINSEKLIYYGLEYKYLTLYIQGKLSYEDMFERLNTAIHQFAKRQMTWFRKMEREGSKIHWIDGYEPMERKLERSLKLIDNFKY